MIRIAVAGKIDPGVAHFRGQGSRLRTAAGHRGAAIGVVEYKCKFATVKRTRPAIKNRSVPGEDIQKCRRGIEGAFSLRLFDGIAWIPHRNKRKNLNRLDLRM